MYHFILFIHMAVCNKSLDMYEVQEGYYACENQDQIAEWLFQNPGLAPETDVFCQDQANISSLVLYDKGSFHVYFLVQETVMDEKCTWLLFIPNFLSKHFDLLCFASQYPNLDINELFDDMAAQFSRLSSEKGHLLPVSGCRHSMFTGFMYDIETILSKN